eukprot:Awhi_evm1s1936
MYRECVAKVIFHYAMIVGCLYYDLLDDDKVPEAPQTAPTSILYYYFPTHCEAFTRFMKPYFMVATFFWATLSASLKTRFIQTPVYNVRLDRTCQDAQDRLGKPPANPPAKLLPGTHLDPKRTRREHICYSYRNKKENPGESAKQAAPKKDKEEPFYYTFIKGPGRLARPPADPPAKPFKGTDPKRRYSRREHKKGCSNRIKKENSGESAKQATTKKKKEIKEEPFFVIPL